MAGDVRPSTLWLRPLWERARRIHRPYLFATQLWEQRALSRRRPASPAEVLALIEVAEAVNYVTRNGRTYWLWEHDAGCGCSGTALATMGSGLCTCGLTNLYWAMHRLETLARERHAGERV